MIQIYINKKDMYNKQYFFSKLKFEGFFISDYLCGFTLLCMLNVCLGGIFFLQQ